MTNHSQQVTVWNILTGFFKNKKITVHLRLSEQLGMKFRNSCSDKLNIRIIEDANASKENQKQGVNKPIL